MLTKRRRLLMTGAAAGVLSLSGLALRAQTRGGTLRAGLSGASSTDTWDGRRHSGLFMIAAAHGAVFDCLTEVAADGSLKGELAESWEASADARTWVFNLRRGVTFHNGRPFGADDVIASLNLHLEPGARSPARPLIAAISGMKKLTDHQIAFTLATANADFPYLMSDHHLLIYPSDQIEAAMATGIGTGLYRVRSFEPGAHLVASRYGEHYKGDSAGFFDQIEYIALNDMQSRMHAVRSGLVDAVDRVDLRTVPALRSNPALRLQEVTGNQHFGFAMPKAAPFDNLDVRRALKYGIDRQQIVDDVLHGHGQIGNDTPIGPANQYRASDVAPFDYDPDRARFHLRQAGYDRLSVALAASDTVFDRATEAGQLFRDSAAAGGIDIDPAVEQGDATALCTHACAGRVTEDWTFSTAALARADLTALMLAARAELDSDKRRDLYGEMQRVLRDDGDMLIPVFADFVQAVRTRIAAPDTIGNLWPMDNARMAERWSVA